MTAARAWLAAAACMLASCRERTAEDRPATAYAVDTTAPAATRGPNKAAQLSGPSATAVPAAPLEVSGPGWRFRAPPAFAPVDHASGTARRAGAVTLWVAAAPHAGDLAAAVERERAQMGATTVVDRSRLSVVRDGRVEVRQVAVAAGRALVLHCEAPAPEADACHLPASSFAAP